MKAITQELDSKVSYVDVRKQLADYASKSDLQFLSATKVSQDDLKA